MKRLERLNGMLVATAALGLLAGAPTAIAEGEGGDEVKCVGINGCSGQGECAAADGSHDCKGNNSCKGKGWVKASGDECTEKGGAAQE